MRCEAFSRSHTVPSASVTTVCRVTSAASGRWFCTKVLIRTAACFSLTSGVVMNVPPSCLYDPWKGMLTGAVTTSRTSRMIPP